MDRNERYFAAIESELPNLSPALREYVAASKACWEMPSETDDEFAAWAKALDQMTELWAALTPNDQAQLIAINDKAQA